MSARRILIVDDERGTPLILAALLRKEGHVVEVRDEGLGTGAHASTFRPDVVVLDIAMPAITGDALARLLQRRGGGEAIILMSARPEAELGDLARKCGANGFVRKGDASTMVKALLAIIDQSLPAQ